MNKLAAPVVQVDYHCHCETLLNNWIIAIKQRLQEDRQLRLLTDSQSITLQKCFAACWLVQDQLTKRDYTGFKEIVDYQIYTFYHKDVLGYPDKNVELLAFPSGRKELSEYVCNLKALSEWSSKQIRSKF